MAAVNYHLGSKVAVLAAVLERVVAPVDRECATRLTELQAGPAPALLDVLAAFVEPLVRLRHGPRGANGARLIGSELGFLSGRPAGGQDSHPNRDQDDEAAETALLLAVLAPALSAPATSLADRTGPDRT